MTQTMTRYLPADDAQRLALGNDQQFIEAQHLLLALINQEDGGTSSLLSRAGVSVHASIHLTSNGAPM